MSVQTLRVEGHRGFPSKAPENTLESFKIALAEGIHGIEFDIWLTSDNVIVVAHGCNDHGLEKMWNPEKGQFTHVMIPKTTFSELKKYKISDRKTPICTLEEVFDAVGYQDSMYLNIEIKHNCEKIVEETCRLIKRKGVSAKIEFCTFNHKLRPTVVHWSQELDLGNIAFIYNIHYYENINDKELLKSIIEKGDGVSLDMGIVLDMGEELSGFITGVKSGGGVVKCYNYMSLTDLEGEDLFGKLSDLMIDTFILNAPERLMEFNRKL